MTGLGLVADDLTGALDSAAQFVRPGRTIPVVWPPVVGVPPGDVAIDAGTRELAPEEAAERAAAFAPLLRGAGLAFKKIDSLLRGNIAVELAAILRGGGFDRCILAPAFPFQGRVTRGGMQYVAVAGELAVRVDRDLRQECAALGEAVEVADAETDEDLVSIASAGRRSGDRILWCGTAGLASALAGDPPPCPALDPGSVLGVIGTRHPVTAGQLAAVSGAELLAVQHPPRQMRAAIEEAIPMLRRPSRVVVTGGETLAALCAALGATGLTLEGQRQPGVPVSRFRGGLWDGTQVISKSGAFGGPGLLRELLMQTTGA